MDEDDKRALRGKIPLEIKSLEETIEGLKEGAKPVSPDNAIGRLSRMEAINASEISGATLASARRRLGGLKRALEELDSENFGICRDCEEPIPTKRIMLMPESVLCVNCAGKG